MKDLNKQKYQFLIKKREDVRIKHFDSKPFIEYSVYMDDFTIILIIITEIEAEKNSLCLMTSLLIL